VVDISVAEATVLALRDALPPTLLATSSRPGRPKSWFNSKSSAAALRWLQ
jgi:hypothetical protein